MEIDRLDIAITASVKEAKAQISQLRSELEGLKSSLNGIKKSDAMSPTSKGADKASNTVRTTTRKMVTEYKKAAKSMSTIRDEMYKKPITMPVNFAEAEKALDNFKRKYESAKDYVLSAQKRGKNTGEVYRKNVENMYNAAEGIKAVRGYMRRRQEQNLEDLTPEQKAFVERFKKVQAGTWDYAKEAAEEAAREAQRVKAANEEVVRSYDDIASSASKAYNVKYSTKSQDIIDKARMAYHKGNEPQLKSMTQWQSMVNSAKSAFQNLIPNIQNVGDQMRTQITTAFDNMRQKAEAFKVSMREKAVANGILSYTEDFVTLQKSIARARAEYARLTEAMREYKAAGGSESDTTYRRYSARADRLKSELTSSLAAERAMKSEGTAYEVNTQTAQANLQALQSAFQRVGDVAKRTAKAVASFVIQLSGIRQAARLFQSAIRGVVNHARKLWKEFERVGKMAKLMVTRMAIRAVLKNVGEGFQSLALHSEAFNSTMSNLINSSKTLGYSIAGMVSPLINALAPALIYIIDLITRAVNALNQLFSALGGATTWNKAKNFTDNWADSIKGAGSAAGKAAKEIKKTVLGFDELNQLQDNKDSGGGGGGGITDMFDTMEIDPKWKKFADWLKDMWKNKDFYDLGKLAGEKLRDWLESIPWDKIRQTSNDLGKCLATLINGFVEVERLGYDIGYTVAQSVNTVFEFINGFVHNLHWESIGKFIADTFNGFFENIDWDLILDTVITGMKGLARAINSFVKNFHWDNISTFIGNAVNTIVKGIYTFFDEVDWIDLARNLGDQLNKTIEKIDWRMLGKTIGKILKSALDFVKTFLKQLDWKNIKKAIQELLKGLFEEISPAELAQVVSAVIIAVVGLAVTKAIASAGLAGLGKLLLSSLFGTTAVSGASAAAASAGTSVAGAFVAAAGAVLAGVELIKNSVFDPDKAGDYGVEAEKLQNLRDAYSGVTGTARIFKEALGELWYTITGNDEALDDLHNRCYAIDDGFGNITKTVDTAGNTIIEFTDDVNEATDSVNGQINVYDNWKASIADASDAAEIGADKMIDIKVSADETGKTVATVAETIFPKLADNTYKAATAEESLTAAVEDYRKKLQEAKDHQTVYKTTLDVIREAQEKNVKIHEEVKDQVDKCRDSVDKATIVIQDNKEAYIKAGEAAKESSDKVADYVAQSDDVITVVPEVNDSLTSISDTMGDVSTSVGESCDDIRGQFDKDKWTLSGVKEGLGKSFENAFSSIKEGFKNLFDWINDKLNIEVKGETINIGRVGYATGGFPEDGLFFANHNEMVGKFSNGKTAVANNAQIVEGIQNGVYNAVVSALGQQSGSAQYISNEIIVDGDVIARSISRAQEKQQRRYSPTV